jgi:hypothetical protein
VFDSVGNLRVFSGHAIGVTRAWASEETKP